MSRDERHASTAKLGDLLEEFDDRLGARAEPEILTLTEKLGFVAQRERFNKRLAIADTSDYKVIGLHDVAFNPYLLWAGAIAQNTSWDVAIISPLYPTFHVRPGHDPRFVNYLLHSPQLVSQYESISFGSVPRKRRAAVPAFLDLSVPKPPSFLNQRRIASILDQTADLHRRTQHSLELPKLLVATLFNSSSHDDAMDGSSCELDSLCDVITKGTTPRTLGRSYKSGGIPFLRAENLNGGAVDLGGDLLYVDDETDQLLARSRIQSGDVLVSIAGTIGRVGFVAPQSPRMNCNQAVAIIRPSPNLEPLVLAAWLKSPDAQRQIQSLKVTATISNLSLKQIRRMRFPKWLLAGQRQFVGRYRKILGLESKLATRVGLCEDLLKSVSYHAFLGEL